MKKIRLKCALTTYEDDKDYDTINELQMKTASLSAKLKEHLKRKVTTQKGNQVHSFNNTRDGQDCLKKLQQNTRRA